MGFSMGIGLLRGSWSFAAFGGSASGAPVHATNAAKTASLNPTITSIIGRPLTRVLCGAYGLASRRKFGMWPGIPNFWEVVWPGQPVRKVSINLGQIRRYLETKYWA